MSDVEKLEHYGVLAARRPVELNQLNRDWKVRG
jgi:hypothetical protein